MSSSKRTMAKGTLEPYSAQEKFGRPHLLIHRAVFVPLKKACKAISSLRCIKPIVKTRNTIKPARRILLLKSFTIS